MWGVLMKSPTRLPSLRMWMERLFWSFGAARIFTQSKTVALMTGNRWRVLKSSRVRLFVRDMVRNSVYAQAKRLQLPHTNRCALSKCV
jgi:hypothetical protein